MSQVNKLKAAQFVNNPDGTTSYYDAITGVKLVDTSLVVDGQTFNVDAKGVVTKAHTPGFYTTGGQQLVLCRLTWT